MGNLNNKKILLIICGGIAAYKSLELIRLLKKDGVIIKTILTKSGAEFVTPLSITSLSQSKVYQDLFSIENEVEMDHISLSRWADLILIANYKLKNEFVENYEFIENYYSSKVILVHNQNHEIDLKTICKNKYEIDELIEAIKISKINFKKSNTDLGECKYYVLETKLNLQDSEIDIKYCEKDKKSFVSKIEKSFY